MIWPVVRATLYAGLGAAEAVVSAYDRATRLARALLPSGEPSQPLSHQHVDHQRAQMRAATERGPATILPPAPGEREVSSQTGVVRVVGRR